MSIFRHSAKYCQISIYQSSRNPLAKMSLWPQNLKLPNVAHVHLQNSNKIRKKKQGRCSLLVMISLQSPIFGYLWGTSISWFRVPRGYPIPGCYMSSIPYPTHTNTMSHTIPCVIMAWLLQFPYCIIYRISVCRSSSLDWKKYRNRTEPNWKRLDHWLRLHKFWKFSVASCDICQKIEKPKKTGLDRLQPVFHPVMC